MDYLCQVKPMTLPTVPSAHDWRAFVDTVAVGGDPVAACEALGYADAAQAAAALMQLPQVRQGLVAATEARLESMIGPLAARVVERLLSGQDESTPAVRAKLAVAMLDRVRGVKVQRPASEGDKGAQSVDELRELVERMERATAQGSDAMLVAPDAARGEALRGS